jgi:hypothetical protein
LTTIIRPGATIDWQRLKQKRVLLSVEGDPLANNETRVADRRGRRENLEVARRKITKRVEIKHLVVREKERALGVIARGRSSDNHSGGVVALPGDAIGGAGSSTECSQIGDGESYLCLRSGKRNEEKEYCCESDLVFRFHRRDILAGTSVYRDALNRAR